MNDILNALSPLEWKVLPFIDQPIAKIKEKTKLDETSVFRALRFLENKGILKIDISTKKKISPGINGIYYKKNGLPERRLILSLENHKSPTLQEAQKNAGITDNEFKAALGVLKNKMMIALNNGKISLTASQEEISKKSPEEHLIESLPKMLDLLTPEEKYAFETLKSRKDIIEITEEKHVHITPTDLGKKIMAEKKPENLIEEVTPELIKNQSKNIHFRHYDLNSAVPRMYGGRKHIVTEVCDYVRKIWLEMGFTEMQGPIIDSSFWVFDALFTAQDHQVRELQDSLYIKGKEGKIPEGEIIERTRQAHEKGIAKSKGWQTSWNESEASRVLARTHTTSLSARTLASLKENQMPAKFFAIGKAFRNETIDWSHGVEFYQTEGIVVTPNANLSELFSYLKTFYKKLGFSEMRMRPSFFPYTEPSVEIDVYHPEKKQWLELGGAGILRPEVTSILFGKPLPVLAWGQGLDRITMNLYKIQDLREIYANDITTSRNKPLLLR